MVKVIVKQSDKMDWNKIWKELKKKIILIQFNTLEWDKIVKKNENNRKKKDREEIEER